MIRPQASITLWSVVVGGVLWTTTVAAQVPPDASWRSLETTHFRVTFPAELEAVARRAGERAERAYGYLSERLLTPPSGRIELLLTDHADQSNGFANALPFNRITVFVRPPMDGFGATHFDDWLETVVTHELVHIFHLDHTGPLGSLVRAVLGRSSADWPAFPGYDVPAWIGEGMATYYESALTESGRVNGSFNDMVLRTAMLEGRFEGPDQVSGLSPNWPAGARVYAYGASFFDHMLDAYGEERMGEFVDAIARQIIPWRVDSGAKDAFGIGFREAWSSWEDGLEVGYRAQADSLAALAPLTQGESIAGDGRRVLFPAVSPDGLRLGYLRSDGRSDIQLRVANPDGSDPRKLTRVNSVADWTWLPDGDLLVAEQEFTDPYRVRSDLVRVDRSGGERWITRGARLAQPTVSPDGRYAVAVQDGEGTNRLVRVDLSTGAVEPVTDFVATEHWASPSWSPDGRWIAASRWRPGAFYDLFVLDPEGEIVHQVTADRAIDQDATWTPDGRRLLWASDRSGIPNLYAVAFDPVSGEPGSLSQITNMIGGAAYPSVDPAGEWIYFSSYHSYGWDVERIRFDPDSWFDPLPVKASFARGGESAPELFARQVSGDSRPYSALQTILPRSWEPIYESGVTRQNAEVVRAGFGARIEGQDLVGRHTYAVESVFRQSGRTDVDLSYAYSGRGNPFLGLSWRQGHDVTGPFDFEAAPGDTTPVFVAERERAFRGSVTLVRQRMRTSTSLSFSGAHIWERLELLDENLDDSPFTLSRPERRLGEAAITVAFSNARSFAFSTTAEVGVGGFLRLRARRELSLPSSLRGVPGSDRSFREVSGVVRGYHAFSGPGFSRHVVAWRASGGGAYGPGANRFHFDVGGAHGQLEDLTGLELFGGTPLLLPVRGYFTGQRSGRYAWTASVEYRFPILNVHRGWGFFPLHVDRVSGALFVDGGNAWGDSDPAIDDLNPRRPALGSVGAELQISVLALFNTRLFFRLGAAMTLTDEMDDPLYLRLGTAF